MSTPLTPGLSRRVPVGRGQEYGRKRRRSETSLFLVWVYCLRPSISRSAEGLGVRRCKGLKKLGETGTDTLALSSSETSVRPIRDLPPPPVLFVRLLWPQVPPGGRGVRGVRGTSPGRRENGRKPKDGSQRGSTEGPGTTENDPEIPLVLLGCLLRRHYRPPPVASGSGSWQESRKLQSSVINKGSGRRDDEPHGDEETY